MNEQENVVIPETSSSDSRPTMITKEDLHRESTSKKQILINVLKTVLGCLISSFLIAFTVYSLITPNNFTVGGIAGTAILIHVASGGRIPQSILSFCMNFPLIVLSFFFVKKKFALLTSINIILQSFFLFIMENTAFHEFVIQFETNGERIFAAIATGICFGAGIAIAFKIGGSTGGIDILAVMIQKKFASTSIAWIIVTLNTIVIGSSIFVFNLEESLALRLLPIMMSLLEGFVEGKVNDSILNGFQSAVEFRTTTEKPQEMAEALMRELSRGVTSQPATGMYTKKERSMLLCVVSRRQVPTLKRVMKEIDPDAFAVMANVSQVLGLGFHSNEN